MSAAASNSKDKEQDALPDIASLVVTGRAVDPDDPEIAKQKGVDLDFGDEADGDEASPLALLPPFYVEMVEMIGTFGCAAAARICGSRRDRRGGFPQIPDAVLCGFFDAGMYCGCH